VVATPRAPRRLRLVPYAAAAAALLIGFWLARDAFDGAAPYGNGPDVPPQPIADNRRPEPAPRVALPTAPVIPVVADGLRLVGKNEHKLREGAEIYSDLRLDAVLGGNDETWTTPVINLRH
jgi:hypothetical protein